MNTMKFGCCLPLNLFVKKDGETGNASIPQLLVNGIQRTLNDGYDFAELTVRSLMQLSEEEFAAAKEALREANLQIPAFNNFIPPDHKLTGPNVDWNKVEAHVEESLKRMSAVGGKVIVFGSGGARKAPEGFPLDEAMEQIKQFLIMCEKYAARYNMTVAIEPLNRKESNIINLVSEAIDLALSVNLPHIKVLADAFHMYLENESYDVLERAMSLNLLSHVHIAEGNRSFPLPEYTGTAKVDFASFFAELRKGGYEGAISAECSSKDLAIDSARSIGYVKQLWSV